MDTITFNKQLWINLKHHSEKSIKRTSRKEISHLKSNILTDLTIITLFYRKSYRNICDFLSRIYTDHSKKARTHNQFEKKE